MADAQKISVDLTQRRRDVFNYYVKRRGMTVKAVAEKAGYSDQTVYNMLSAGEFSREASERLSKVLLCSPDELVKGQLCGEALHEIDREKTLLDYEIISDDLLWMRTMMLSQQRTIENLSAALKEKGEK